MTKCLWTGQEFPQIKRGANEKVFVNDRARAEAHLAARRFTEYLIDSGFMSWEGLRQWHDAQQRGDPPSNTTKRKRSSTQPVLPLEIG